MIHYTESPLLASLRGQAFEPAKAVQDTLIDQIRHGLTEFYCHLPQKEAAFGIKPAQQLRILKAGHGVNFTRSVLKIITGLRDRHTTLRIAPPWSDLTAYLPFIIEFASANGVPQYLVTKQLFGFDEIDVGSQITHWNGVPMYLQHLTMADESQGGNLAAALRLGLSNLTVRPLAYSPMPNEDWVTLTYRDTDGAIKTKSTPWRFFVTPPAKLASGSDGQSGLGGQGAATATQMGLDERGLLTKSFVKAGISATAREKSDASTNGSFVQDSNLRYGRVNTQSGECAYLRIFSFNEGAPKLYVEKMAKVLQSLPQDRLIIDIRGNPGGTIPAGQGLLRLLKKGTLTSSTVAFRATDQTARIAGAEQFGQWQRSLLIQVQTGDRFSQAFTIADLQGLPEYRYPGKIALILDAESYSTSDFFSADFADNDVGVVIGTDMSTGGGGANVWTWETLVFFAQTAGMSDVGPLPMDYSLNISIRRAYRTGALGGLPIEDLAISVEPGNLHVLTMNDLMNDNADLLKFAASKLSS